MRLSIIDFKKSLKKDEVGLAIIEVNLATIRPGEYTLYFWLGDKKAIYQGNPVNYDVVEDMTEPLIIKSKDGEEISKGIFSLPSKIICQ